MLETKIPDGQDPCPAINKIMAHFTTLIGFGFDIPHEVKSMMLIAKAPKSMEAVVQLMASETDRSKLRDLEAITNTMYLAWETSQRQGVVNVPYNQQRANKLSAVKQGDQNAPQFQQQRGDGTWQQCGRPRRGKRGGKKNAQQQLQQGVVQELRPSAPEQPPPPSFQFTPQEGYFALMASVPFIPPTPPPPSTSVYTPFNRALDLTHSLGVRPSTETLKTLEVAKIEKARDPRPKK